MDSEEKIVEGQTGVIEPVEIDQELVLADFDGMICAS